MMSIGSSGGVGGGGGPSGLRLRPTSMFVAGSSSSSSSFSGVISSKNPSSPRRANGPSHESTPTRFRELCQSSASMIKRNSVPAQNEEDDASSIGDDYLDRLADVTLISKDEQGLPSTSLAAATGSEGEVGHSHPNWGTLKSTIILLVSTVLFSLIAEVLIDSVDDILKNNKGIDEKFLGLTLFALVPSVTEFCKMRVGGVGLYPIFF